MKLDYYVAASHEIGDIGKFYADQSRQLAIDFREELVQATDTLMRDPLRFEQLRPGIRRFLLERFPYGVYFRMPDDATIRIIAVKHHSRRPGLGMRRT